MINDLLGKCQPITLIGIVLAGIVVMLGRPAGNSLLSNQFSLYLNHAIQARQAAPSAPNRAASWIDQHQTRVATLSDSAALALYYHVEGDHHKSLDAWRDAQVSSAYLVRWGEVRWREQNSEEAQRWFSYAVQLAPSDPHAWWWLGKIHLLETLSDEAIVELQQATLLAPNNRDAWFLLALALLGQRQEDEAVAALWQAERSTESYGDVGKSNIYFELAQLSADSEEAWLLYQRAFDADDFGYKQWQKANIYFQRGLILAAHAQFEASRDQYDSALELNADAYFVKVAYARTLLQLGEQQQAIEMLLTAVEQHPKRIEALLLLGDSYFKQGDTRQARTYYLQALIHAPDDPRLKSRLEAVEIEQNPS